MAMYKLLALAITSAPASEFDAVTLTTSSRTLASQGGLAKA